MGRVNAVFETTFHRQKRVGIAETGTRLLDVRPQAKALGYMDEGIRRLILSRQPDSMSGVALESEQQSISEVSQCWGSLHYQSKW